MDNKLKVDIARLYEDKWSEYGIIVLYGKFGLDWIHHRLSPYLNYPELFRIHWSKN